MSQTASRRGLTLMELVVVMLILVALAGILVPLMTGVNSDAQYTSTKATMASLRNAVMQYYQDMKGIPLQRTPPGTTLATDSSGMPQTLKDLQVQPTYPLVVDANGNPLAYNPVSGRGWRGPYVLQATGAFQPEAAKPVQGVSLDASFYPAGNLFGNPGDPAFLDAWGNPIVLEWPAVGTNPLPTGIPQQDFLQRAQMVRLVSAGAPTNTGGSVLDTVKLTGGVLPWMPTHPTASQPTLVDQRGNDILLFILTQDLYPWMPTN